MTFDDRGRTKTATSVGVVDFSYSYDGADNLISFNNATIAGAGRTMTYDKLNRLSTATASSMWGTATYGYDAVGNRTFNSIGTYTATYTYDAQTNRLVSASAGNFRDTNRTFTWDSPGRLASSSPDGATYFYDGSGRRIQKADSSGTVLYHYDPAGRLLSETTSTGQKLRDYVYLGQQLVVVDGCIVSSVPPCGDRQWYHTDTLGTVVARTDPTGAVVARFDYKPWGEPWSQTGAASDRQYNGRVFDAGTGFYDYGARMYWPFIGRFISADTAAPAPLDPDSFNSYSYVLNNPYKYTDPNGKFPFWTHNKIIELAFLGTLPSNDIATLKFASAWTDDRPGAQAPELSFQHAMRAGAIGAAGQTAEAAQMLFNHFIERQLTAAVMLERTGHHDSALLELGQGMHAIMDMFSSEHEGFQEWRGFAKWVWQKERLVERLDKFGNATVHVTKEAFENKERYQRAADTIRGYYNTFVDQVTSPSGGANTADKANTQ